MLNKEEPQVSKHHIEYQNKKYIYKDNLKRTHALSYQCVNYYVADCPFLLWIPINSTNYDLSNYTCRESGKHPPINTLKQMLMSK